MGIEEFLLASAKKEGIEESIKGIALKMKESGLNIELITNITRLSIEEVENLA